MSTGHEFRPGLEFDVPALEQYLGANLAGFSAPLRVRQFPGGQSNPTYRLDTPSASYVLRRKPPGQLLPSAHAIEREYRVMLALANHTQFPVGQPLLLCEEPHVIGTAFYVMEHVEGRIFWDPTLPELSREARRPLFVAMAETLADLHSVDYVSIGLADFGKPEGYVARQLARWSKQYTVDASVAGRVDEMERLIDWLARNAPGRARLGVIDGGRSAGRFRVSLDGVPHRLGRRARAWRSGSRRDGPAQRGRVRADLLPAPRS